MSLYILSFYMLYYAQLIEIGGSCYGIYTAQI
jgi:hypothetical protein